MPATFSNLLYHVVFSTKNRASIIHDHLQPELFRYIGGIVRSKGGILLEVGGMPDHIHLVLMINPHVSVSEMVCGLKSNSSKWIHETTLHKMFAWQSGYGAFTVSRSQIPAVRKYVRNQPEHHRVRSFQEEFLELLKKQGIDNVEQKLWD